MSIKSRSKIDTFLLWASRVLLGGGLLFAALMPICFFYGFPLPVFEHSHFRIKGVHKLYEYFFILFAAGLILHPERKAKIASLKEMMVEIAGFPGTIWILSGLYFLLFLWQQVSKYFALEINFLPFLFFDYMLWFFQQGKFCFTGLLHGYYHLNLIMFLIYPIWKMILSPWVLHVASPLVVASSAVPFYFWTKKKLNNALMALVVSFIFLNFRFVENLLEVNFAVEVFYPFFIFSAVYFALVNNNFGYYTSLVLGLLVKEDSAIYFGALGLFYLISSSQRKRGIWTIVLSALYPILLLKVVIPWSGNTILRGDLNNYPKLGSESKEMMESLVRQPWLFLKELFYPWEKIRTFFKLTSKLLFLPLISPWFFLVLAAVYPLYFHSTGQSVYFFQLSFYYGAAVLPFLFLAFVDGWQRFWKIQSFNKPLLIGVAMGALLFLNGFNLRPLHFDQDDLKTIQIAKSIPKDKILVTQGHLLPYAGYRYPNFYISKQYSIRKDTKPLYENPDYFLFDFEANAYPQTPEELRQMANSLKTRADYKISFEDHRRLLLEKITKS